MKLNKLFLTALAAVSILASCSKDSDSNDNTTTGGDDIVGSAAKLTLTFKGNGDETPKGRAIDGATHGTTITDATLFVMNSNDGLVVDPIYIPTADINASPAVEYAVTTSAKYVIIVANVGNQTGAGQLFDGVATLADLQSKVAKLSDISSTASLWMYGRSAGTLAFTGTASDGTSKLAQAAVTISLIPARIDVKVQNNMTHYGEANTITLEGVSILYSAAYSHLIPTSGNFVPTTSLVAGLTGAPKYYLSGMTGWSTELTAQNATYASLNKTWATPATAGFAESFYALPGGGAHGKHTIITVYADAAGSKRYFPVHFTTTDVFGETLTNGKHYTVNINLKGDARISGEPDPEEEIVSAYIEVEVTVGSWIVVPEVSKPME